ncbi:carbohydrate kinase family protein [Solimonas marina]|uniref:Carbohydrate kinase n=1 Tax=Solimonas marina TaxID=2714601 RepID=A0A970B964_9GAMM|nr:carbohydrate kinase [Solimonas marina]NKF22989.1 carbohydrate kinase [Solimonas marina]
MPIEPQPWPSFVVFGEALTDLVRVDAQTWRSVAGGSCWNVARVAATLGMPSAWAGAVGDDPFGRDILELTETAGLDMRFAQRVAKPPLLAIVHETHPPQYFFVGNDAADLAFDEARLPKGWESHCRAAHFGCISLVREPLGSRLERIAQTLSARGTLISFDPNHRNLMGPDYRVQFERLAAYADVIKISDEDAAGIYPELAPADVIARLRQQRPDASLLYTRGSDGLSLYRRGEHFEQRAFAVKVADTVGAGDACLGAFVCSLLSSPDADPATHLRYAAATAALVCTRSGAYAPSDAQVRQLMAEQAI